MARGSAPTLQDPFIIGDQSYDALARTLSKYERRQVVSMLGGLLTVPRYQAQGLRLEILQHLAVLHCKGKNRASSAELRRWLEISLGNHPLKSMEDPPEDVFVSNVTGPGGNFRIFEGTWYSSDAYLQDLVTCIVRAPDAHRYGTLRSTVLAALALSDAVAARAGLQRWDLEFGLFPEVRFLRKENLNDLMGRVTFSRENLAQMGLAIRDLEPLILTDTATASLSGERWSNTSLVRHPLVQFGDEIVVAIPSAISPALRLHAVEWMDAREYGQELFHLLRAVQRDAALEKALRGLVEGNVSEEVPESPPPAEWLPLSADSAVGWFDTDKLVHVLLAHDNIWEIPDEGLGSPTVLRDERAEPFQHFLARTARMLAEAAAGGGLSILVSAGLGRPLLVVPPEMPVGWHFLQLSLPDFNTLGWDRDASLLRLWKLYEQREELTQATVLLQNLSGPLNLLAFAEQNGFALVPPGFPFPAGVGFVHVPSDRVLLLRLRERLRNDVHAVPLDGRRLHRTVRRLVQDSYFDGLNLRPIYAVQSPTGPRELSGVVEGERITVRVNLSLDEAMRVVGSFVYQIWESILQWLERMMPALELELIGMHPPVTVDVRFPDPERWGSLGDPDREVQLEEPVVKLDRTNRRIEVEVPFGFTALLARPTNDGERHLMEALVDGLVWLWNSGAESKNVSAHAAAKVIIEGVMHDPYARDIHLYVAPDPTYRIRGAETPQPRFVQPEDRAVVRLGLGWAVIQQVPQAAGVEITNADRSSSILNAIVARLWEELRKELETIDAAALIRMTLANNEETFQDRKWWRQTARALTALYGRGEDVGGVAGRRDSDRALAIHAGRTLIEMAVPTCPIIGGRSPSQADFDGLLATVATLLDYAADSDAIHGRLGSGHLRIHPNGFVEADRSALVNVANPYAAELQAISFREAIASYNGLYESARGADPEGKVLKFKSAMIEAFRAEYSLAPDHLISALAELFDLAEERGKLVTQTTRAEISDRLIRNRGFSAAVAAAYLDAFTLVPRERWDSTPEAFQKRDWIPWRYRRRLSLVARPLASLGTESGSVVFYGVNQVAGSVGYLLEGIENASLPNEFFASATMQQYRGTVAQELGLAFEHAVANELSSLGWTCRVSVQMTELGGSAELGDVDVLAWHVSDPRVLLIECKRLQTARGIGEIVERLNQFRGDAKDRLGKHLRRHAWVVEHLPEVLRRMRIYREDLTAVAVLLTNAEMPMQFQSGLPIPENDIVPFRAIPDRLAPR